MFLQLEFQILNSELKIELKFTLNELEFEIAVLLHIILSWSSLVSFNVAIIMRFSYQTLIF